MKYIDDEPVTYNVVWISGCAQYCLKIYNYFIINIINNIFILRWNSVALFQKDINWNRLHLVRYMSALVRKLRIGIYKFVCDIFLKV